MNTLIYIFFIILSYPIIKGSFNLLKDKKFWSSSKDYIEVIINLAISLIWWLTLPMCLVFLLLNFLHDKKPPKYL